MRRKRLNVTRKAGRAKAMKTILAASLLMLSTVAYADGDPQPPNFQAWQRIWQCNDIRVTETVTQPGLVTYDLGGTIWGGIQFTLNARSGALWMNSRPCLAR